MDENDNSIRPIFNGEDLQIDIDTLNRMIIKRGYRIWNKGETIDDDKVDELIHNIKENLEENSKNQLKNQ